MASAPLPVTNVGRGYTVVTQVIPSEEQNSTQTLSPLSKFLKGEPKALGHIISGSLAVSASNKLNSCVVTATMILNIFSTVSAGITIIFLFMALIFGSYGYFTLQSMRKGITGVLLVFTLLQFCISIALSAFTCKAICTSEPTLNIINVVQNPESFAPSAPVNNPFPPHHTQQGVNMMHGVTMATAPGRNPPAYSEKILKGQTLWCKDGQRSCICL
ncbi:membrane-spanning 4-domains subfamily A member 4D-like isoform X2 [Tachysurus fulvidraco]|uniref:membrane-spanning 4-domains subfamily A member 4D-like isoform X2 n=1 Tax=Tachysurus fulvidraco TaxID=1234273 RepID=UPI001FEFBB00|nr:membrane-spanning 4-domains subfamily A member 4D-like isoform X2 [Tachysurus fulvidraco]